MIQTFAPELPWATVIPADPSGYRPALRSGLDIDHLAIHVTDGRGDPVATARMFQQAGHASAAHLIHGQAGQTIQCVRLHDIAWHAHRASIRSIGMEHCARTPGELGADDLGLAPSDALYAASARAAAWICRAFGWDPAGTARDGLPIIIGHKQIDPETTHDDCPNGAWDWVRYMAEVHEAVAALGPLPQ